MEEKTYQCGDGAKTCTMDNETGYTCGSVAALNEIKCNADGGNIKCLS